MGGMACVGGDSRCRSMWRRGEFNAGHPHPKELSAGAGTESNGKGQHTHALRLPQPHASHAETTVFFLLLPKTRLPSSSPYFLPLLYQIRTSCLPLPHCHVRQCRQRRRRRYHACIARRSFTIHPPHTQIPGTHPPTQWPPPTQKRTLYLPPPCTSTQGARPQLIPCMQRQSHRLRKQYRPL